MIEVKSLFMTPPAPPSLPSIARSKRTKWIARSFGLNLPAKSDRAARSPVTLQALDERALASLVPAPGEIVLITGASGAGKSSLLRAIRALTRGTVRWIDLDRVHVRRDRAVVDLFGRASLVRVLEMLSRVGLAEVWTYLRTPRQLSEGQRWRLRLALALMRSKRSVRLPRSIVVCDEFAALLDRVTAAIVARTLRRAIAGDKSALVATSHEDLIRGLNPNVVVRCDFGRVTISRHEVIT